MKRHEGRLVFLEYTGEGKIDKTLFLVGKVKSFFFVFCLDSLTLCQVFWTDKSHKLPRCAVPEVFIASQCLVTEIHAVLRQSQKVIRKTVFMKKVRSSLL